MPRQTTRTKQKTEPIPPKQSQLYKKYKILPGEVELRWQESGEGGTYSYGKAHAINSDGSVDLYQTTGGWRCIMPKRLQKPGKGPKGGKIWTPLVD